MTFFFFFQKKKKRHLFWCWLISFLLVVSFLPATRTPSRPWPTGSASLRIFSARSSSFTLTSIVCRPRRRRRTIFMLVARGRVRRLRVRGRGRQRVRGRGRQRVRGRGRQRVRGSEVERETAPRRRCRLRSRFVSWRGCLLFGVRIPWTFLRRLEKFAGFLLSPIKIPFPLRACSEYEGGSVLAILHRLHVLGWAGAFR